MKKLLGVDVPGLYSFSPDGPGAGTITFSRISLKLSQILLIVNVTANNTIIYNFADAATGSAGFIALTSGNFELTLAADTGAMNSTDELLIYLDLEEDGDQYTRVGGIDPNGYPMGLSVNARGHVVPSDQEIVTRRLDRVGSVASVDTTGYNSIVVQLTGTWAGTQSFEVSNDGSSWSAVAGWIVANAATPVTSVTASGHWIFPCAGRFFRVRFSTYTSGNAVVNLVLKNQPAFFPTSSPNIAANSSVNIGQIGAGAIVAEDTASTANPLIVGGVVRTALPAATVVAGDAVRATFSRSGQLVLKQFAPGDLDFAVSTTVTTATQTAIRAAQGADIRQSVTSVTFQNTSATATTLTIQDASATLVTFSVPASMTLPVQLDFPTPLRGSANAALNYTAGTTGSNILLTVTGFNSY
jgi:hypothetical protein